MARSVLASELLARVRTATDTENDTHITDAEIYKLLTAAVAKTWNILTMNGLGGEGVQTRYFNAVNGQIEYNTSSMVNGTTTAGTGTAGISDFYKVKTLYVNDGTGSYRPVSRVSPNEQYALKGPSAAVSMKLCYLPTAPTFSAGSDSFDGICGWEEHAIQLACIEVKKKKMDDAGQYRSSAHELEEQIKKYANRNMDEPPRVIRRRAAQAWANRISPYAGGVYAWDLRGNMIELYAPSVGLYL